jgi:molybdate transport system substrate-binding protein
MNRLVAISLLSLVHAMTPDAHAAELKVIAGGSMTGPLKEIVPQFEAATGHKLSIHFDSTPNLIKQATSDAPLDLAVVPVDLFKDAAARAHDHAIADACERARQSRISARRMR